MMGSMSSDSSESETSKVGAGACRFAFAGGLNMSPNSLNFARIVPLTVTKGCLMWLCAGVLPMVFMISAMSDMQADNASMRLWPGILILLGCHATVSVTRIAAVTVAQHV